MDNGKQIRSSKNRTSAQEPLRQQATFSSYKNRNTLKVVVGSTPGGLISYVSPAYGGSTSDRQVIERSRLGELCDPGDAITADKGFNIQDILATHDIQVTIPTFLKRGNRFTPKALSRDRKIASERVHIELHIGLVKTNKILTRPMTPTEASLGSGLGSVLCLLFVYKLQITILFPIAQCIHHDNYICPSGHKSGNSMYLLMPSLLVLAEVKSIKSVKLTRGVHDDCVCPTARPVNHNKFIQKLLRVMYLPTSSALRPETFACRLLKASFNCCNVQFSYFPNNSAIVTPVCLHFAWTATPTAPPVECPPNNTARILIWWSSP